MTKSYVNVGGVILDTASVKLPENRKFRAAWRVNGDAIEVDLDKAKQIFTERLERRCREALARLSIDEMLARGNPQAEQGIAAKLNRLKGLLNNPNIATATTVAELEALWPSEFPEND